MKWGDVASGQRTSVLARHGMGAGTAGAKVVQLVANPAAGNHCADRLENLARAFARAGACVIRSECGPHRDLEIDRRASHLCVVGGDGTLRHVALAALRTGREISLSLYPAGTVNLVHREARCELEPDLYARRIVRANLPRRQYAAMLDDGLFLACASAGPDSAAVAALSPGLKRWIGRYAYAVAFLKVLLAWQRPRITLTHDGTSLECEAFYVAKGRYFAGPWSFAPQARVDEPMLHVVALETATRRAYARFLWAMLRGRRVANLPGVRSFTCTALRAESGRPVPVQADGDVAAHLPVDIRIRPEPLIFH